MGRSFTLHILLFFVIFIAFIETIFLMNGWTFAIEFVLLLGLLLLTLFACLLIYNRVNFGYFLSALITAIILLNFIAVYARTKTMPTFLFVGLIGAATAFVLSVVQMHQPKMLKPVVLKTYKAARVVASKSGKLYHKPRSAEARRIKRKNKRYFDSEEEARKAKLKPGPSLKRKA